MIKSLKKISSILILSAIISASSVFTMVSYGAETTDTETQSINTTDSSTTPETGRPIIVVEIVKPSNTWNGNGDMSLTLQLSHFNFEFGNFNKLLYLGKEFDGSNYTLSERDGNIVITFKEQYLKTLANGKYYFDADFLNATISPAFRFDVDIEEEESTTTATTTPILDDSSITSDNTSEDIQSITAVTTIPVLNESPKTSDNTHLVTYFILLILSTITALGIGKARKNQDI